MSASNTTFYVSPDGNDHNPGTIDLPLLTLTGARDKDRSVLNGIGNITDCFHGVLYHSLIPSCLALTIRVVRIV
jgi:hypothetical protein